MADYDLAIIGGGINGTGFARDAAGRGLRVLLVEQNDLASGTSSASTKLIHGGLRYLEHGAFRLVREALREREVLLRMAPHVIRPLRFVLPPAPGLRSALRLRLGLFIYDMLGGRKLLPATSNVDLTHHPVGQPLKRSFRYGFEYSDCRADDARLVVLNALDAAERGADIRTRTPLRARRAARRLAAGAQCARPPRGRDGARAGQRRRALGRRGRRHGDPPAAAGAGAPRQGQPHRGAALFEHDRGYLLQAADGRVVFALPFERDFTLIGTTDENFVGDLDAPAPEPDEILYLCHAVNEYFRDQIAPDDVVWAFAGVRSLYDDGADKPEDVTRDYVLDARRQPTGRRRCSSVYGGKITTYRRLAEAAMARLAPHLGAAPAWTAGSPLPGGDFPVDGVDTLVTEALRRWPFLAEAHARRLVRAYGTRVERILGTRKAWTISAALCRRPDRRRGALSDRERMGAQRRRRAVAAQQARPERHARARCRARCLHRRAADGALSASMVYQIFPDRP